jgi:hypothetical protein
MWCRNRANVDVLKPEVDAAGYDVVFSMDRLMRHVQIKASRLGAAAAEQQISGDLATHQSSCVIWAVVDASLRFKHFFWYGGAPGEPMPDISGLKPARQARANAQGIKAYRKNTWRLPKSKFTRVCSIQELAEKLFGAL